MVKVGDKVVYRTRNDNDCFVLQGYTLIVVLVSDDEILLQGDIDCEWYTVSIHPAFFDQVFEVIKNDNADVMERDGKEFHNQIIMVSDELDDAIGKAYDAIDSVQMAYMKFLCKINQVDYDDFVRYLNEFSN